MKLKLLLLLLFISHVSYSATYYFSSTTGDDSRTAAQAQNPSTPWKTVGKLNSYFSSLQPGDFVFFKRGETFYGGIVVSKSGTSGNPITIGAYGSGDKPIITGMSKLSNWVSIGGGIWESYNSSLGSSVNVVTINSAPQTMGRFPNKNAANGGYLHFESHSGTSSITDNQLSSTPNWTGGEAVIRTSRWVLDRVSISGHSGGTLSYITDNNEPTNGYGYFIQDHIKTLDQEGEWYYKPSTKKMHLYNGSSTPSNVEASSIENIVYGSSKSYITFDNLQFKGSNGTNINLGGGGNIVIRNCDVFSSGVNGINVTGGNSLIENSTVTNSYNDGIVATGSGTIIRNNVIRNSFYDAGKGLNGNGKGAGIRQGSDVLIEYNQIYNSGYVGIHMGGDNSIIKNNLIDGFCLLKDDGGGIYTSNGHGTIKSGRKIIGNIIINAAGAGYGTVNISGSSAEGIYMDDYENGIEISGNTISNIANRGIYLHNTWNIAINNNTMFNNGKGLEMKQDRSTEMKNHTVLRNIFYSVSSDQSLLFLQTNQDNLSNFGSFDDNFYENRVANYNEYYDGGKIKKWLDLEGWKNEYGEDQNSKFTPSLPLYKLNSLIGSNKFFNGKFDTDASGIWGNDCAVSWEKSLKLDGGYAKIKPSEMNSNLVINVGSLDKSKKYIIRFSAITDHSGIMSLGVNFRQGSSGSATMSNREYVKMTNKRTNFEMVLEPTQNEISSNIVFVVDETAVYYLDNIQVFEANVTMKTPEDNILFEYNASKNSKTISLNENFIDVNKNKYSGSIILKPYSSIILWKDTSTSTTSNTAPTVSITSPASNSNFTSPASITINSTASDVDGTISKVEFFADAKLLGTSTTNPYSFTWSNVSSGTYSLTAKATDNNGLSTTSTTVSVNVEAKANTAPTVSITSPASNSNFTSPASITINSTASDVDGTISKVEFFADAKLLGTSTTNPYSFTWSNVSSGTYSLTAKATDNNGLSTTSTAVSVNVEAKANTAPTVSITSPASNSNFTSPASITINSTASDVDGTISKVEFFANAKLLGTSTTSPYSFTWSNVSSGTYSLTAKATDNNGLSTTSTAVSVNVEAKANTAPTVSITSPASNSNFTSPASITINSTASDVDGTISKVEFFADAKLLGTSTTSPYSFTWSNVSSGTYSLTAKATDNNGLSTTSTAVSVNVEAKANTAPTVSITSPASNSNFTSPASITINSTASDVDGTISKVEFFANAKLLGTSTTSPYSFTWSNVSSGTYSLTAKATDNNGLSTTSTAVSVNVEAKANTAPTVSITSPASNSNFTSPASITINSNASDVDGTISKVEFFANAKLLGTSTTSPYSFTWSNVSSGTYSLTAIATDNNGLSTTSTAVSVNVEAKANTAPTVNITSPASNSNFTSPASITINSNASDVDGTISKVEFFANAKLLGTSTTSPYSFTWSNVSSGTYSLTAKATDNNGLSVISSTVNIKVDAIANTAPTVKINSPATNTSFLAPTNLSINAGAFDPDGTISKVEFFADSKLIGTKTTTPYTISWSNIAAGTHSLTAKATDNKGLSTTSSVVIITVEEEANTAPTVKINSPAANTSFVAPANLSINAGAFDPDGTISKVEFFAGTKLVGTKTTTPYTITWSNVSSGTYSLTAKATDNKGLSTTSSVVIINVEEKTNMAPTVKINSPAANSSFIAPANLSINAGAFDPDGTISKVEFFAGTQLVGTRTTTPYTITWSNVTPGTYSLTVKATDNNGLSTISSTVVIKVEDKTNKAPTVSITSPAANTSFITPASLSITAGAFDQDGKISKVEFFAGTQLIATKTTTPYTITWTNVTPGTYSLTAKATDDKGLTSTSAVVMVKVEDKTNTAPTVKITSPAANSIFVAPASMVIKASASDVDGTISKVEFFAGTKLIGTSTNNPYSITWSNVTPGTYSLTAIATDNKGLTTTSPNVSVKVEAEANSAPTVKITSPSMNTSYTVPTEIEITARAFDQDGTITKVEFFEGTKLIGTKTTTPYSITWSEMSPGSYSITAKATDNNGLSATSSAVTVKVEAVLTSNPSSDSRIKNSQFNLSNNALRQIKMTTFPNPAVNELFVKVIGLPDETPLEISIVSMGGIEVQRISTISQDVISLDVSALFDGVYVIRIVAEKNTIVSKFIKRSKF